MVCSSPFNHGNPFNTSRSDILYSSTWDAKRRFPFSRQVEDENDNINTLSRFATSSVTLNRKWFPSNPVLLAVIETMRRISCALSSSDLGRPDRAAVSYRIRLIEHQLTSLHDDNPRSPDSNVSISTVDLSPAFRLAALLYIRISFRELPPIAKMHLHLVHRIRLCIESDCSTVDSCTNVESLELIAWISFMGGATAIDSNDRKYFVGLLVAVCRVLGIQQKAQLHTRLVGVCWKEGVCEESFGKIWKEIRQLQHC
jgi:hypothetical protein